MQRAPSVTIRNDTVQANLVEVGSLELQHLVDARAVDLIRSLADLAGLIIDTTKLCRDQPLAELVKEIECAKMGAGGNLDQLCESVSYLPLGQSSKECEVEECVHGRMVRSETVLIVAVVNGDLDANTGINQTDDCRRNSDEVSIPPVCSTGKSTIAG
jgi:hypothetical protein